MSVAVFGKVRNLNICCGNDEKYFYGDVAVGGGFITQANPSTRDASWIEGFVSVYSERSEKYRSYLATSAKTEPVRQLLESYPELESLAYIEQFDGSRLSITMMLAATDFNSFASLVERHYLGDLEYSIQIPVPGFAADVTVEENLLATFGAFLPTEQEFLLGTPFYIPNCAIDLEFHHLTESASQKYEWLNDNKRQLEDERQPYGAEPQKQELATIKHNRTLNQLLAIADARQHATFPRKSENRLPLLYVGILLSIVIACGVWLIFHG
jgi:hypothetical protein